MATFAMRAVGTPPLARARAEPISSRAARPRLRVRCLNRAGAKSFHTPPALHPRGWTSVARSTVAASDAKRPSGFGVHAGAHARDLRHRVGRESRQRDRGRARDHASLGTGGPAEDARKRSRGLPRRAAGRGVRRLAPDFVPRVLLHRDGGEHPARGPAVRDLAERHHRLGGQIPRIRGYRHHVREGSVVRRRDRDHLVRLGADDYGGG